MEEIDLMSDATKLTTEVTAEDGFQLACVQGAICDSGAEVVRQSLEEALPGEGGTLVVDLSGVDYISSSGIGTLVSILKRAHHAGGALVLCGLTSDIHELFTLTHLDQVFTIASSVEAYRKSCS